MNISWTITKKRGNWRPVLQVTLRLEDWELDLGLPDQTKIQTNIPKPPYSHLERCLPGLNERAPGNDWK